MTVAGVDGCRNGWVVARAESTYGSLLDVAVVPSFADVVTLLDSNVEMIAVDMPIGLPDAGDRSCDRDARQLLGARHSTVFPAPPRPLLDVNDYPEALTRKRAIDGKGLSKQSFFLLPKIAEVDAAITPERQRTVVESHPELAFLRLLGTPLPSKHTEPGRRHRIKVVHRFIGPQPLPTVRGADMRDVLDAVVLTATALHLAKGTAERLGDGRHDARGLVMEIAW